MVLIDWGAATHAGAKKERRPPDLERSAGLSTSTGGGGAGATPGSRAAGIVSGVVVAARVRPASGVAAVCGGLAGGSRVGRGAGGLGGVAPSRARAPAPEGLGVGPASAVGVARVAGTGGVCSPGGGILTGRSMRGRREGVSKGPRVSRGWRGIKGRGLVVPSAEGGRVHRLAEEVGGLIPGGVGEETGTDEGRGKENIINREWAEGPQYLKAQPVLKCVSFDQGSGKHVA